MSHERTETTVKVTNLPRAAADRDFLHRNFLPFGEVVEIEVVPLRPTHRGSAVSKNPDRSDGTGRTAYVEFSDPADAAAAIDNMDLSEFYDTTIYATRAEAVRPAEMAFDGLGSNLPLWEQEGFVKRYMQGGDNGNGDERERGSKRVKTTRDAEEDPMAALEKAKIAQRSAADDDAARDDESDRG